MRTMSASLPRHRRAWHEVLATETAHKREPLLGTNLDATEAAQARAAGWCRPRRTTNTGGALAHGRRAEQMPRATLLETLANRTSARARPAPKRNPGSAGNELDTLHQIARHDGSTTTDDCEALVREPRWLAGRRRTDGPPEQWRRTRTASTLLHADVRAA